MLGVTEAETVYRSTLSAALALTVPSTAVMVTVCADADAEAVTVERNVPSLCVVPDIGEKESTDDAEDVSDTARPAATTPVELFTVTVTTALSPAATVVGDTTIDSESADTAKAGVVVTARTAGTARAEAPMRDRLDRMEVSGAVLRSRSMDIVSPSGTDISGRRQRECMDGDLVQSLIAASSRGPCFLTSPVSPPVERRTSRTRVRKAAL
ncbi:hypothetical protein HR12_11110 [Microbacterium sp. SUBG005]|nr:hypothetical protein HR12_11110 [Microbacterium sp. SUBG005]